MTSFVYASALLISLAGLGALDWRYRIALFHDARRTLLTLAITVAVFVVWDIIGIQMGIFFVGDAPYLTGVHVAPELPLEELLFLTLLTYQTLLLWRAFVKRREGTQAPS